jgi:hypothetical protein
MKYGYSLLLTEKTFTKRVLKGFDAEKLFPELNAGRIELRAVHYSRKSLWTNFL